MQQTPEEQAPSLEDQFQIYAKELGELYITEQRRRAELAEEKLVLEHRVKELEALNRMFQTHLARRIALEEALQALVEKLRRAAEGPISSARAEIERIAEEASLRLLEESLGESAPPSPAAKDPGDSSAS